jgi:hypothetical protein
MVNSSVCVCESVSEKTTSELSHVSHVSTPIYTRGYPYMTARLRFEYTSAHSTSVITRYLLPRVSPTLVMLGHRT